MKTLLLCLVYFILTCCVNAQVVSSPQTNYLTDYQSGNVVRKFNVDVNNDGVMDWFFNTVEANPDQTTQTSDMQNTGSASWEVYVSNQNASTFTASTGIEINGILLQGTGLKLNPNLFYVGSVSEIGRYGIVTLAVKRSRSENSHVIYAYTWEADHFKQWKLAEYLESEQNAIFDKYLKEDKRTHVTLQQIKP